MIREIYRRSNLATILGNAMLTWLQTIGGEKKKKLTQNFTKNPSDTLYIPFQLLDYLLYFFFKTYFSLLN